MSIIVVGVLEQSFLSGILKQCFFSMFLSYGFWYLMKRQCRDNLPFETYLTTTSREAKYNEAGEKKNWTAAIIELTITGRNM